MGSTKPNTKVAEKQEWSQMDLRFLTSGTATVEGSLLGKRMKSLAWGRSNMPLARHLGRNPSIGGTDAKEVGRVNKMPGCWVGLPALLNYSENLENLNFFFVCLFVCFLLSFSVPDLSMLPYRAKLSRISKPPLLSVAELQDLTEMTPRPPFSILFSSSGQLQGFAFCLPRGVSFKL